MQLAQPNPQDRHMSVSATLLAAAFALCWPILLGFVGGLAAWWLWGEYRYFGYGVGLGVAAGIVTSAGVVGSSWLVTRVTAPAPAVQATPNQTVIRYAPLGSAPGDNIRIVPLQAYDKFIDNVKARDVAWFCKGISRGRCHSQRAWLGKVAPSGQLVDPAYWRALSRPLRRAGIIRDVGPRRKGHVTTRDLNSMLAILGIQNEPDLWLSGDASEV